MNSVLPAPTAPPRSPALLFAPITRDLEAVERIVTDTLASPKPHLARMVEHLRHYRGKRLRPVLLLLTAQACGRVTPAHHTLGAVVEMVHTATLVHDDVLDEAGLRRHVATVNAGWGNPASILLGDYLFTHAFHLASSVDARACALIGEATNRVCEGELHQTAERGNLHLTEEQYFDVIGAKTAALTACACRLGAVYSGGSEGVVEHLTRYGRLLGMAFQVADDLLDLTGQEQTAGKTLGTDLEQQKLTLPLIHALPRAPAEPASRLRQALRHPTGENRDVVIDALRETGAIGYAKRKADELAGQAAAALECLPATPTRDLLRDLTVWATRREK